MRTTSALTVSGQEQQQHEEEDEEEQDDGDRITIRSSHHRSSEPQPLIDPGVISSADNDDEEYVGVGGVGAPQDSSDAVDELPWNAKHATTLRYFQPIVEDEFVVYHFRDRRAVLRFVLVTSVLVAFTYLLCARLLIPQEEAAEEGSTSFSQFFTGLVIAFALTVMCSLVEGVICFLLMKRYEALAAQSWQEDEQTDLLRLFSDDCPIRLEIRRNAACHEWVIMRGFVYGALFACALLYLRPECQGLSRITTPQAELQSCKQTLNAEAVLLLVPTLVIKPPRLVLYCLAILGVVTAGFIVRGASPSDTRAWEHDASFGIISGLMVIVWFVRTWFTERRSRLNFEQFVEQRFRAASSAWLKKQTEQTLAAQVPPGAGLAAAVKDRDGMWGMSPTLAVCGVSIDRFREWASASSPYDVIGLLAAVVDSTDEALVLSESRATRYHSLGDMYLVSVALPTSQVGSDGAQRADPLPTTLTALSSNTHSAALSSRADLAALLRFCVLAVTKAARMLEEPFSLAPAVFRGVRCVRAVLHVGPGSSVTLWGSKSVVLAGPILDAIKELSTTTCAPATVQEVRTAARFEITGDGVLTNPTAAGNMATLSSSSSSTSAFSRLNNKNNGAMNTIVTPRIVTTSPVFRKLLLQRAATTTSTSPSSPSAASSRGAHFPATGPPALLHMLAPQATFQADKRTAQTKQRPRRLSTLLLCAELYVLPKPLHSDASQQQHSGPYHDATGAPDSTTGGVGGPSMDLYPSMLSATTASAMKMGGSLLFPSSSSQHNPLLQRSGPQVSVAPTTSSEGAAAAAVVHSGSQVTHSSDSKSFPESQHSSQQQQQVSNPLLRRPSSVVSQKSALLGASPRKVPRPETAEEEEVVTVSPPRTSAVDDDELVHEEDRMGHVWLVFGNQFLDESVEARFVQWARAPFPLAQCLVSSVLTILTSATLMAVLLLYQELRTLALDGPVFYAALSACAGMLRLVLLLTVGRETPKVVDLLLFISFWILYIVSLFVAPKGNAVSNTLFVMLLPLQPIRTMLPPWFTPFALLIPSIVSGVLLPLRTFLDPVGTPFALWTTRVWLFVGTLTAYRAMVALDLALRDEYIALRQAQRLQKQLDDDFLGFQKVLEKFTPTGVAAVLVRQVQKPLQGGPAAVTPTAAISRAPNSSAAAVLLHRTRRSMQRAAVTKPNTSTSRGARAGGGGRAVGAKKPATLMTPVRVTSILLIQLSVPLASTTTTTTATATTMTESVWRGGAEASGSGVPPSSAAAAASPSSSSSLSYLREQMRHVLQGHQIVEALLQSQQPQQQQPLPLSSSSMTTSDAFRAEQHLLGNNDEINEKATTSEQVPCPPVYKYLQLIKATNDTLLVAMDSQATDDNDNRMLLDFVCRVHKELQSVEGLQHRAVVSSGPVVGCVLGSRSVSFEYYGAAVCVASRLLEEVPWGSVAAASSLLRSAVGCLAGRCPEDVDADAPVEYVVDVVPGATLRGHWSASQRWQVAALPPCRLRVLQRLVEQETV